MARRIFGEVSDEMFSKVLYRSRDEDKMSMAEVMSAAMYAYANRKIDLKEYKEYYNDLKRQDMCLQQKCTVSKEEKE